MKFTKEDAYKELVRRMTEKGEKLNLSERTLNKHLETLMKFGANDETELSAFLDSVIVDFTELNGQYRKDFSDSFKEWEKEQAKKKDEEEGRKNDPEPANEDVLKMMKRIEELESREKERETASKISSKRKELEAAMEKKGIKDKDWRNDFLAEINITEDLDVDAKADSFLKIYNKSKASGGSSTTPFTPDGGGSNKSSGRFDYIKKEFEREQEKMKSSI